MFVIPLFYLYKKTDRFIDSIFRLFLFYILRNTIAWKTDKYSKNICNLEKFSEEFYVLSEVISGNCTRLRVHTSSKIDGFLKFVPISHDANDKKKETKSRRQPTDAESDL